MDVILVVGFTCGTCKSKLRNLLTSGSVSTKPNEHEKKIDKLSKDIDELKKQTKSVDHVVSDTGKNAIPLSSKAHPMALFGQKSGVT